MNLSSLPATIASSQGASVPADLVCIQAIEVKDELKIYKELSMQLVSLEKTMDYDLNKVSVIEHQAQQMIIALDEKEELLMRCDWLVTMKEIEKQLSSINSLDKLQVAKYQLGRVQTSPLKKELTQKLESLEAVIHQLPQKESLVEDIFATGNETFINLGTAGRDYILEVLRGNEGTVEAAIAKAEELEAKVQEVKKQKTVDGLRAALKVLPLQKLAKVPAEYEEEVLQKLLNYPYWNSLFHLDHSIQQYTLQISPNTMTDDEKEQGFISTLNAKQESLQSFGIK